MLEVRNINKTYGKTRVLADVTCKIEKNKFTAFIGSNGAGKSTLINIIARTLKSDKGQVIIDGMQLAEWKTEELAKKIAILSQFNHINIRLTVRELVSFGRYPHSKGKITDADKEKIDEALEYLNIKHLENKFLDELSGGQVQMAYIAMVIAQDTDYILLDEPLNNLDMNHSVKIMKVLRKLVREKGKTVIVVIHDINFVSVYADNVIALKNGSIITQGLNEEVITRETLKDIYSLDMDIHTVNNCRICMYYK
ncbi:MULTISPECIES: ABC transporter ATP-binding protein [unclassified Gemella]|uniref:iron ABC transporter ATP-binding protein n=1 Tax=unclassified Gemella TaxID=2624949 RepID=UPI001C03F551|nr:MULTISPECIES: ATP-binding cassette domain-containing protein [unclassified Gemella]MBU0279087.1 ATP-binding cassette domain-containing protein [Gemella sp. zg-1178]QWQ39188.1 ATP-binding cassette domain-containing protein [Gemella sp. zg-570]